MQGGEVAHDPIDGDSRVPDNAEHRAGGCRCVPPRCKEGVVGQVDILAVRGDGYGGGGRAGTPLLNVNGLRPITSAVRARFEECLLVVESASRVRPGHDNLVGGVTAGRGAVGDIDTEHAPRPSAGDPVEGEARVAVGDVHRVQRADVDNACNYTGITEGHPTVKRPREHLLRGVGEVVLEPEDIYGPVTIGAQR